MSLSIEQKEHIEDVIISCLRSKFQHYLIQLARRGAINITNIVSLTAACTNSSQTASIHKKQVKL